MTGILRSGTAHAIIDTALRNHVEYRDFRDGLMTRPDYSRWVESQFEALSELGLNLDKQSLSTRFPPDDHACVTNVLAALAKNGLIADTDYPVDEFEDFAELVSKKWDHGDRTTFIFPEEARLMFALAHRTRPRNAVFLGSYYGYWAVWALPAVAAAGGRVTLVDIDPDVMALAERNIAELGYSHLVDFVVADATEYARTLSDVDLCVLDAEGPLDAPDPDLRDKAIYYPHTRAISHALPQGALLVAHNVLLQNLTDNAYFAGRIANNEAQYARWTAYLDEHYDVHQVFPTSEGVGVYRRNGSPCAG
ncbi:class I SAM-dependent methyltransferase [Lentzea sp. BCCO 10_0798]|uniref:Class I SAM-dependent methyltransferase n=1 Tax=Lentzea kristufekii TaxID=3095430 RepID=A0ABU4U0V9_9PSEU|nr:class I SAM-dependent methyltransferase [Lentzea sp. BCCO 10_0798]MDX8053968.1 class I SAM-dependent methyltransferase [Lentzea sp. BCCO 10_0798]